MDRDLESDAYRRARRAWRGSNWTGVSLIAAVFPAIAVDIAMSGDRPDAGLSLLVLFVAWPVWTGLSAWLVYRVVGWRSPDGPQVLVTVLTAAVALLVGPAAVLVWLGVTGWAAVVFADASEASQAATAPK